jgi:hypothetical protein
VKPPYTIGRLGLTLAIALSPFTGLAAAPEITVYESPACGCCASWVTYLKAQGFKMDVRMMNDVTPVKDRTGVPVALRSCHTAEVGGYVIEGHVPAQTIKRLLSERPKAKGIAAPGMPQSAPGMDGPYQPYDILIFGGGPQKVYEKR